MTSTSSGTPSTLTVTTADGRSLEVRLHGPDGAHPLVFHHGTPGAAAAFPLLEQAVDTAGLRLVTVSRPGYGASTPRSEAATVAADVDDTVTVLDHLGLDEFVTLGWSGGGPRALACAALLPERCRAAASWVGVAPREGFEDEWLAGMGEENVEEFGAALAGEEPLRALLEEWHPGFATIEGPAVAEGMGDLLPDVDRAFLTPALADWLAATFRHALREGIEGWLHDDIAFTRPWGVDLGTVTVPTALWQGRQDRMVPLAHAERLATLLPDAEEHLTEADGHLSMMGRLDEIVAGLARRAGWAG